MTDAEPAGEFAWFRAGYLDAADAGSGRGPGGGASPDPLRAAGQACARLDADAGIPPTEKAVLAAYGAWRRLSAAGAESLAEALARAGLEPREPG